MNPVGPDDRDASGAATDELFRRALRTHGRFAGRIRLRAVRRLALTPGADAARSLAEVFTATTDERVAAVAREALTALTGPGDSEARDAVCELAMAVDDPRLTAVVEEAGHTPSDPGRRALRLFLTGEFAPYEELDFDGALLRSAYASAPDAMRARIAERARSSGRVEWIRAVTVGPDRRRKRELSDDEWETSLRLLGGAGQWEELWHLVPTAPLPWAVSILRALGKQRWHPRDPRERDRYDHLLMTAVRCGRSRPSAAVLFTPLHTLTPGGTHSPTVLTLRGDLLAVTETASARVRMWHLPSGTAAGDLRSGGTMRFGGALAFGPDGGVLVRGNTEAGNGTVWRLPSGDPALRIPAARGSEAAALTVTPDGTTLVAVDRMGWAELWDLASGDLIRTFSVHAGGGTRLAVTPDSRLLVTADYPYSAGGPVTRSRVRLWRLPSGRPAVDLPVPAAGVTLLKVTPDGRFVVAACADQVTRVWRLPSATLAGSMPFASMWVEMSADGGLLAGLTPSGARIEVRRVPTGEVVTSVDRDDAGTDGPGTSGRTAFSISADNRLLLVDSGRGTAVRHLPSGEYAGLLDAGVPAPMSTGHLTDASRTSRLPAFISENLAVTSATGGRISVRKPENALYRTPVSEVTAAEAEAIWQRHGPDLARDDRPWLELLTALVEWRQRFDVALDDAEPAAAALTDIEVSE